MTTYIVVYWYLGHLSVITIEAESDQDAMARAFKLEHIEAGTVIGAAMAADGGFTITDAYGQAVTKRSMSNG